MKIKLKKQLIIFLLLSFFVLPSQAVILNVSGSTSGDTLISDGATHNGLFDVSTILNDFTINSASFLFEFSDDDDLVLESSTGNTNHHTNTQNGFRTATRITNITKTFSDALEDVTLEIGGFSDTQQTEAYSSEETTTVVVGPTRVPRDECFITFGFFFSCQNVEETNTTEITNGFTGDLFFADVLSSADLSSLISTGSIAYAAMMNVGDIVLNGATLLLDATEKDPVRVSLPSGLLLLLTGLFLVRRFSKI